jgi:hypothetical protein
MANTQDIVILDIDEQKVEEKGEGIVEWLKNFLQKK